MRKPIRAGGGGACRAPAAPSPLSAAGHPPPCAISVFCSGASGGERGNGGDGGTGKRGKRAAAGWVGGGAPAGGGWRLRAGETGRAAGGGAGPLRPLRENAPPPAARGLSLRLLRAARPFGAAVRPLPPLLCRRPCPPARAPPPAAAQPRASCAASCALGPWGFRRLRAAYSPISLCSRAAELPGQLHPLLRGPVRPVSLSEGERRRTGRQGGHHRSGGPHCSMMGDQTRPVKGRDRLRRRQSRP